MVDAGTKCIVSVPKDYYKVLNGKNDGRIQICINGDRLSYPPKGRPLLDRISP
jgi:hypothetical protein